MRARNSAIKRGNSSEARALSRYVNLHFSSLCLVLAASKRSESGCGLDTAATNETTIVRLVNGTRRRRRRKESRNPREPLI